MLLKSQNHIHGECVDYSHRQDDSRKELVCLEQGNMEEVQPEGFAAYCVQNRLSNV